MSSLKDKAIKWLGGFTKAETEEIKAKALHREPCIVHDRLNTVTLCCEDWLWRHQNVPGNHMRHFLAEGLAEEIEKYMNVKEIHEGPKVIFRAEIEVVVREGAE